MKKCTPSLRPVKAITLALIMNLAPEGMAGFVLANGQIARADDILSEAPVIAIGRVSAYCGSVHFIAEASWTRS